MSDRIRAVPAPLHEDNIDTDVIFPARFLLLLEREGLGKYAFFERRQKGGFLLDSAPWKGTKILVAGRNFGTGSSREQAVWALEDAGIRCIIAQSFGEIFFANCFRNGLLPIVLPPEEVARIEAAGDAGREIVVDLPAQTIALPEGPAIGFEIAAHRKAALLAGLDEIGAILADDMEAIAAYEARLADETPWALIDPSLMDRLRESIARDRDR